MTLGEDPYKRQPRLACKVIQSQPHHVQSISTIIKLAHGVPVDDMCPTCPEPDDVLKQIQRVSETHFVAVITHNQTETVIGTSYNIRTNYGPDQPPLAWEDMIGDLTLSQHNPNGRWLYGCEMSVHPDYQGMGIGSALYKERFKIIRHLKLRGLYCGGMLKGYKDYHTSLTQKQYARKVLLGEIRDPTVSMQMGRGLEARGVIESYDVDPDAGNAAMLLVWEPMKTRIYPSYPAQRPVNQR